MRTSDVCVVVFHRIGTRGKRIGSNRFGSFARPPNPGALREGKGWSESPSKEKDTRCSGTESIHLFRAESRVARMFCSHCFPI